MAPRRPKTAANDAAEFDFDVFLSEFERPQFTRNLYRKGKLVPRLAELGRELDELEARIERWEKVHGDAEQDITGTDQLSELRLRLANKTEEWNAVAEEFNESAVPFTFRIPDETGDPKQVDAWLTEAGIVQPDKPDPYEGEAKEQYDREFSVWWDAWAIRSIAVSCVSHKFTVEQWEKLRDHVGVVAFSSLAEAWVEAVQAAKPSAPFSLRPLPIQDSEELSPASELL